ncbi:MAG: hypothetical protein L6N95_01335, partial [Candidatus Methylarchaceae archaeon HK01B]|nr:hypothetical protein [Candidatus Methylarchaceae archaeon HK01B]
MTYPNLEADLEKLFERAEGLGPNGLLVKKYIESRNDLKLKTKHDTAHFITYFCEWLRDYRKSKPLESVDKEDILAYDANLSLNFRNSYNHNSYFNFL